MSEITREILRLNGQDRSVRSWKFSAQDTRRTRQDGPGEWYIDIQYPISFVSGLTGRSETGEIGFGIDSRILIHWRDAPDESPFVIVSVVDDLDGLALQARYATRVVDDGHGSFEHIWTDWTPLIWDVMHRGYVGIGPASDGSIGARDHWGFIDLRLDDQSDWTMTSARLGWIRLPD